MNSATPAIPYLDLKASLDEIQGELNDAAQRVIASGRYVLGPELSRFEGEFAEYCGAQHAVGVGSGLEALTLSLRAWGIGAGDEVIVPASTFIATWLAVAAVGADIVGVDVDPVSYNLTVQGVADALSPRTRAIIPVHLYGRPADLTGLMKLAEEKRFHVLADAAQAHGATLIDRPIGGLAEVSAFSFYPTKNLGGLGDGGAVVTNDPVVSDDVRSLRNYGSSGKYKHDVIGVNSRLDEIQAAFLRVKLGRLDTWVARRRALAEHYRLRLQGVPGVNLPKSQGSFGHAHHIFPIFHSERDKLQEYLSEHGVGTLIHYPTPPHLTSAFACHNLAAAAFPVSENMSRTELSLPLHENLSLNDLDYVIDAVRSYAT